MTDLQSKILRVLGPFGFYKTDSIVDRLQARFNESFDTGEVEKSLEQLTQAGLMQKHITYKRNNSWKKTIKS